MKKPAPPKNLEKPSPLLVETILAILVNFQGPDDAIGRNILLYTVNTRLSYIGCKVDDRALRRGIEWIRSTHDDEGSMLVAKTYGGGGYFMARDKKELKKFVYSDLGRSWTTLSRCFSQLYNAGLHLDPELKAAIKSQLALFDD